MGYLCPVCGEPFGGAEPLANHLAVSAILHGADHETWLVDTFDEWASLPRGELADALADHATETDEDHDHPGQGHTGHDHRMGHTNRRSPESPGAGDGLLGPEADRLDADATAILREARALTQAMQAEGSEHRPTDDSERETADDDPEPGHDTA